MTMLRSNLHRLLLRAQIFKYRLTISKQHLDEDERNEIVRYIYMMECLAITNLQHLYMPMEWPYQRDIYVMLLKGEEIRVSLQLAIVQQNEKNTILDLLLQKIMYNTKFLQCAHYNGCFNSFDERQANKKSITPGFSLKLWEEENNLGVFIKPCYLEIDLTTSISDEGDIFIDITTGKFFRKTDVVRVQKLEDGSQNLHFRNKLVIPKKYLKLATIKDCVGYDLAFHLKKFLQRIDMTSKEFMKRWSMELDTKPIDMQLSFVDPGLIVLGRTQKFLNQWIYPTTRNTYNNNYKNTFESTTFDAFPQTQLIVCSHQKSDKGDKMKIMLEVLAQRLKLKTVISTLKFSGTDQTALGQLLGQMNRPGVYMFVLPHLSKEVMTWLKDQIVKQCIVFDIVHESDLSDTDMPLNEVTVLQHLGTICSKMRLAPWKFKDPPFGELPVSVASVSLERKKNGMLSLALVFSLNSFLSKFMSEFQETTESQAINLLFQMLRRCLQRFLQLHKIFPMRLFIFTSSTLPLLNASTLYPFLRDNLIEYYRQIGKYKLNGLCVINHSRSQNLRLFNQNNTNFISQDTVRQPGLLSHLLWQNKMFLQLHNHEPLTQFEIASQQKDPSFLKKLSQLIVRLALGSVGGKYGGGLGFLAFSQKLNRYRQFQIEVCWKKYLYDGNMVFL